MFHRRQLFQKTAVNVPGSSPWLTNQCTAVMMIVMTVLKPTA